MTVTKQRTWTPVERRLIGEWLPRAFPTARLLFNVKLGAIDTYVDQSTLTPGEVRYLGVWRRWVDGLAILPTQTVLVEAAVLPDPGDISRLDLYRRLWPSTPEFADVAGLPVRCLLLYAVEDEVIKSLATERGIETVYYCPPWANEYVRKLYRKAPSDAVQALPFEA